MKKTNTITGNKIKVLIGLSEIEGHDRGPKYVTTILKNAGMEVVLIFYKRIQEVVDAAIQEDVDVIGISSYTGAHMTTMADLIKLLKTEGRGDILVLLGGIIPTQDKLQLKEMGVGEIFGPGTIADTIIDYIAAWANSRNNQKRSWKINPGNS